MGVPPVPPSSTCPELAGPWRFRRSSSWSVRPWSRDAADEVPPVRRGLVGESVASDAVVSKFMPRRSSTVSVRVQRRWPNPTA